MLYWNLFFLHVVVHVFVYKRFAVSFCFHLSCPQMSFAAKCALRNFAGHHFGSVSRWVWENYVMNEKEKNSPSEISIHNLIKWILLLIYAIFPFVIYTMVSFGSSLGVPQSSVSSHIIFFLWDAYHALQILCIS